MKNIDKKLDTLIGKELKTKKHRDGDDGNYGRALEEALGVKENNLSGPDINEGTTKKELKTTNGKGKITNFSKEPKWNVNPKFKRMRDFFDYFCYTSEDDVDRLNLTLYGDRINGHGFSLKFEKGQLFVVHDKEGKICSWDYKTLKDKFKSKMSDTSILEHTSGVVTDHVNHKGISIAQIDKMLKSGIIVIETRLTMKPRGLKNRGTAFRVSLKQFSNMYAAEE